MYLTDAELHAAQRKRRLTVGLVVVLVVGGFAQLVAYVNGRPPPNLRDRFADVAPFVQFNELGPEGWAGRVDATWPGLTDVAVVSAACDTLALRLAPATGQTILLLGPDGLPVHECVPR